MVIGLANRPSLLASIPDRGLIPMGLGRGIPLQISGKLLSFAKGSTPCAFPTLIRVARQAVVM